MVRFRNRYLQIQATLFEKFITVLRLPRFVADPSEPTVTADPVGAVRRRTGDIVS
jgi:hypothetical protein